MNEKLGPIARKEARLAWRMLMPTVLNGVCGCTITVGGDILD